jgi:peptidoglycan L-alanyl-D-glutamate endopeptidase CwlK
MAGVVGSTTQASGHIRSATRSGLSRLAGHRRPVGAALLIVLIPAVTILLFKDRVDAGAYTDVAEDGNAVVAALLKGEQLVPPAALPPEVFTTREVLTERPMIVDASRDWMQLDAEYRQKLLTVFQRMREHGYEMALIEGYRSPQRQDKLAAMGGGVTNARAFQSYHQYGLAADCAFIRDGRLVISERDPWAMQGYEYYGKEAEAAGLTWGGRWKLMDFGHTELRRPGARQTSQPG